tara:strand:+ start:108 stop:515 length:408 start_codon:yes stop_codon:yes gene_type:complete
LVIISRCVLSSSISFSIPGGPFLSLSNSSPFRKWVWLRTWWLNLHTRRVTNGLPSRQVFDESVKDIGGEDIASNKLTNIRYLSKEFAQFQETVIVGDHVAIAVFSERPYAFLIKDKLVAEGYRKHFEVLWKRAKK